MPLSKRSIFDCLPDLTMSTHIESQDIAHHTPLTNQPFLDRTHTDIGSELLCQFRRRRQRRDTTDEGSCVQSLIVEKRFPRSERRQYSSRRRTPSLISLVC